MKSLVLTSLFMCLATVTAGVVPTGGTVTNIQGPSSQSRIVGPDGSVITAQAPGGQIIHEETPAVFKPAGHFLGPLSQFINPSAPGMAAHKAVDTVVSGPAGTITTGEYNAPIAEYGGTHSVMGVV